MGCWTSKKINKANVHFNENEPPIYMECEPLLIKEIKRDCCLVKKKKKQCLTAQPTIIDLLKKPPKRPEAKDVLDYCVRIIPSRRSVIEKIQSIPTGGLVKIELCSLEYYYWKESSPYIQHLMTGDIGTSPVNIYPNLCTTDKAKEIALGVYFRVLDFFPDAHITIEGTENLPEEISLFVVLHL